MRRCTQQLWTDIGNIGTTGKCESDGGNVLIGYRTSQQSSKPIESNASAEEKKPEVCSDADSGNFS